MKRKLLSLALISFVYCGVNAQTKEELKAQLQKESLVKEEVVNKFIQRTNNSYVIQNRSAIASISEHAIQIDQLEDKRANAASNVDELQSGAVGGFALNGENMIIGIYDGGAVLATHGEFRDRENEGQSRIIDAENGETSLSSHSTNVAGVIAAEGRYNYSSTTISGVSQGVLPKAKVKSSSFNATSAGDRFVKLVNNADYISNHSYGVNNGWAQYSESEGALGAGFYYPVNTTIMTDPGQTLAGAYQSNDQSIDRVVYSNNDYIVVKSAGNYFGTGPSATDLKYRWSAAGYVPFNETDIVPYANCYQNAYCIGNGSLAKNIIVVGAIDLPTTSNFKVTSTANISKSSYSSAGPRKDGAIKPDLVSVGTLIYAPTSSGTSISTATRTSGTSFAAPLVTGAVGSLTQLKRLLTGNNSFNFKADEMKAILIHTAMEAGEHEGPDNWYGWGLLDAKKAADVVLFTHEGTDFLERNVKVSGTDYQKLVSSRNGEPIKVTLSWIDPAAQISNSTINTMTDTSSKLVNDFDLRIVDMETNEVYMPWKLDLANVTGAAVKGDNTVDNVEQITINAPVAGRAYKVVVSNKDTLVNASGTASNQTYTLLITGAVEATMASNDVVKSQLSVYPTVATDVVNVKSDAKLKKVEVIDLAGKLISTTTKSQVNVSGLPSGVYILNITTEEGVTSKKIVKQ